MKFFTEKERYGYRSRAILIALAGLVLLIAVNEARGQEWSYTGSLEIAGGDYIFTEPTLTLYMFNGFSVAGGPFRLSTNIPVIMQTTPWISYSGAGMLPTGGEHHPQVGQRNHPERLDLPGLSEPHDIGLGDPISRLEIRMLDEKGLRPTVNLLTSVKFPVADVNRAFGTGEWDYGGGFSLSKTVRSRFYSLEFLYWSLGDLPELELKDPVAFNFTVGQPLLEGAFDMLISISGYSRIIEDVEHSAQFGISLIRRLESDNSISVGMTFGITESAPDLQVSLGWMIG